MQFKPLVGNVWSVRIGDHYRAVAQKHGDLVVWFWIGTHEDYNNFIKQLRSRCFHVLKLSRYPRSFAATLATLPSISEAPFLD
jgi:hypothetical protein